MPNPNTPPSFDEDAVLRDLEQLRGQILEARSRREQKLAEFDAFVKESRAASHAERLAAIENLEAATRVQSAARTAHRANSAPIPPTAPLPPSGPAPPAALLPPPPSDVSSPVSRRVLLHRRHRGPVGLATALVRKHSRAVLGLAGGVLLAIVVYSFWGSEPDPAPQSQSVQPTVPAASPTATPAPAAAAQPPAMPDTRPIQIQLEAIRAVWMQVVVDGRREIGRTVSQGQRLSFGANDEISLRAGDAGAVRLYVAGVDRGVLGRDGQVVNRRFTK